MKFLTTPSPDLKHVGTDIKNIDAEFNDALQSFFELNIEKYTSLKNIQRS